MTHSDEREDRTLSAWIAAKQAILGVEPTSSPAAKLHGFGPDALCVGAQKAGTTWLYANLAYHPLIWLPPIKEIHYFKAVHLESRRADTAAHVRRQITEARAWWTGPEGVKRDAADSLACLDHLATYELTDAWYRRIFDFRGTDQLAVDIGPGYSLLSRDGIRHAQSINPNVKAIAFVRDPVERGLSHARMLAGPHATEQTLWDVLRSDAMFVIMQYSDYPRWLGRWRGLLDQRRMFVATSNAVRTRPLGVLESLCGFLGVPFHPDIFPEAATRIFAGTAADAVTDEMRVFVRGRMRRILDELRRQWPELAAEMLEPDAPPV